MLQQFTWQQFLVAAMVFSLVWYAAVFLLFYRKEIRAFFNRDQPEKAVKGPDDRLPHRWENEIEELSPEDDELIGKTKLPEGMSSVSMAGVNFIPDDQAKQQQIGLVPDVLEEIKVIFGTLEKEDGSKRDFFNLMEMVREKYPKIGSHPSIPRINGFIAENAPFHLSAEELENLWD